MKSGNNYSDYEQVMHKQCPIHPKSRHTLFECVTIRKSLNAPPSPKQESERTRRITKKEVTSRGLKISRIRRTLSMSSLAETADSLQARA
jgi:hypothetical protein